MPQKPQKWPDCNDAVRDYLNHFVTLLAASLGNNLTGVYLHGSLAMGCYYPPKSDMDVIAVSKHPLDAVFAEELLYSIALFSKERPTVGDIEFSLITADIAKTMPNPMPYELHYSAYWHDRILRREVAYTQNQFDSDLFAHLLCLKQRGVCLCGAPVDDAFGMVRWDDFLYAVLDDLDWVWGDENILDSPYYCILNACRALQLLVGGETRVRSKEEGALWGLSFFPAIFTPIILQALAVYRSAAPITEANRKRGGIVWDDAALLAFRDYARGCLSASRQ